MKSPAMLEKYSQPNMHHVQLLMNFAWSILNQKNSTKRKVCKRSMRETHSIQKSCHSALWPPTFKIFLSPNLLSGQIMKILPGYTCNQNKSREIPKNPPLVAVCGEIEVPKWWSSTFWPSRKPAKIGFLFLRICQAQSCIFEKNSTRVVYWHSKRKRGLHESRGFSFLGYTSKPEKKRWPRTCPVVSFHDYSQPTYPVNHVWPGSPCQ